MVLIGYWDMRTLQKKGCGGEYATNSNDQNDSARI